MKRSFFDKMFIFFLITSFASFIALAIFINLTIGRVLINEEKDKLQKISSSYLSDLTNDYFNGNTPITLLKSEVDHMADLNSIDIWILNSQGTVIYATNAAPRSIFDIDHNFPLGKKEYTNKGSSIDLFGDNTLSVGYSVMTKGNMLNGYVLMHSSLTPIKDLKYEILQVSYVAFFACLLVTLLFLYHFTRTILVPLNLINAAANEFANGNFDTTLDIHDNYEIGQLATSLDNMADELSKLDEYRKNFISNVSHDFRSPLTSINGYIEAILDGTIPPEKQEHYLGVVLQETKRLTKLTSGLLTLTDFDSYGPILKKTKFDICAEINSCIQAFDGLAKKKQLEIVFETNKSMIYVLADKEKIKQVIYNLLDNAIKFSPTNSQVSITANEKKDLAEITISDHGTGFDETQKKHIFERFYKADISRGKDKQGTGLGLSIVKEIIKAHNETITATSKTGKGSSFMFTLKKA